MPDLSQTCFLVLGPTTSECAAWVQAWGSVAAILAAVFLAHWQHRRDLRQRQRAEAERRAKQMESAFQLTSAVAAVCNKVITHCARQQANSVYFRNALGELIAIRGMLSKFAPDDFDGYPHLEPLVAATAAADAMAGHLQRAAEITDTHDQTRMVHSAFEGIYPDVCKRAAFLRAVAESAKSAIK